MSPGAAETPGGRAPVVPDRGGLPGVLPVVRPVSSRRPMILAALSMAALLPLTYYPKVSDNVISRLMMMESLVEHQTLVVDRSGLFRTTRPVDVAFFRGNFYSDKPPVLSVLASPIYWALTLVGIKFLPPYPNFLVANLVITWLVAGGASALAVAWLRQLFQAVPIAPWAADLIALGLGFASQMLTYSVSFNNHSIAAALIVGGMARTSLERPGRGAWRDRLVAGLLAGMAAVIDLPAGCLMLAGLGAIQAIRARSIPWAFLAGVVGPLLLHGWLQSKVTGTPLPVEMYPEAFKYPGSHWLTPEGAFHEYGPRVWFVPELLIGPPGLLTLTPTLAFGLVGLVMALRRRGDPFRPMAAVVLGSLVVLVVYYTWLVRKTDIAGDSFGTRHLLAITPAIYAFSAVALGRLRGWWAGALFALLTGVGAFYAYEGWREPWARVEDRARVIPELGLAQRFVIYPYSRTRHEHELARRREAGRDAPPPKARP
jgi:hypothetical protein